MGGTEARGKIVVRVVGSGRSGEGETVRGNEVLVRFSLPFFIVLGPRPIAYLYSTGGRPVICRLELCSKVTVAENLRASKCVKVRQ